MSRFDVKYMRVREIAERFGVCRQTVLKWAEDGRFPRPLRFNLRTNLWLREEIDAHEARLKAERDAQPAE